ncbi:MAG: hypothetical protein IJH34_08245 [Romboutsia sp.]|nr:hypothetical protein [Romboutsia sp.]
MKKRTEMYDAWSKVAEEYHRTLEVIRKICTTYTETESYIIDKTFIEFLELVFNKANEVLK